MKRHWRLFLFFTLLTMIAGTWIYPERIQAASRHMTISAQEKSLTSVKISWKKKKVTKYKIYRAVEKKDGTIGTFQWIATLKGDRTSYTDKHLKTGKIYHYRVKGYQNNKQKFCGDTDAYTMVRCDWAEYQIPDAKCSTSEIDLHFGSSDGVVPDGYEIYRAKDGSKKFSLVKSVKKHSAYVDYKDTDVKAGMVYDYKVRAYVKVGKRKHYSSYTPVISMSATNKEGKFTVSLTDFESCGKDEVVLMLYSSEDNGETKLSTRAELEMVRTSGEILTTWDSYVTLTAYSFDHENWIKYPENQGEMPSVKGGGTIWIRLKSNSGEPIHDTDNLQTYKLYMQDMKYNRLRSVMTIDLLKGTARAGVDMEAYH